MGFKITLIFFADLLFPILQGNGPIDPGGGGGKVPIVQGIILLIVAALGIGIKTFSKKKGN